MSSLVKCRWEEEWKLGHKRVLVPAEILQFLDSDNDKSDIYQNPSHFTFTIYFM